MYINGISNLEKKEYSVKAISLLPYQFRCGAENDEFKQFITKFDKTLDLEAEHHTRLSRYIKEN